MNLAITTAVAVTRAERQKNRRVALVLAGLCIHCGTGDATTGAGLCARCSEKNALRSWARYVPKFGRYGRRS